jgi:hypothetical protein
MSCWFVPLLHEGVAARCRLAVIPCQDLRCKRQRLEPLHVASWLYRTLDRLLNETGIYDCVHTQEGKDVSDELFCRVIINDT